MALRFRLAQVWLSGGGVMLDEESEGGDKAWFTRGLTGVVVVGVVLLVFLDWLNG